MKQAISQGMDMWHRQAILPATAILLLLLPLPAMAQSYELLTPKQDVDASCFALWDTPEDVGANIDISSDSLTRTADGDYSFTGNVQIRRNQDQLLTNEAIYKELTGEAIFPQSFQWARQDILLKAEHGRVVFLADDAEDAKEGSTDERPLPIKSADISEVEYRLYKDKAHGKAEKFTLEGDLIELSAGSYSLCPYREDGRQAWNLQTSSININKKTGDAVAKNVRLQVLGVPIFYVPALAFQVGDKRRSGFLPPRISTSSYTGFDLFIPYYFNLAPNQDATVTLRPTTKSGLLTGAEYRYLASNDATAVFNGEYATITDDQARGRGHIKGDIHSTIFNSERTSIDLNINAERVSGFRYFEDYTAARSTDPILRQKAEFSLLGDYGDSSLQLNLLADGWQALREIPEDGKPYRRLPQINWSYDRHYGKNISYGMYGDYTYFARDTGITGSRLDVSPWLRFNWDGIGQNIQSTITASATTYDLQRTTDAVSASPHRTLPMLDVDYSKYLASFQQTAARENAASFWHLLQGRLRYNYVAYRSQDDLPLFDTVPISVTRSSQWYARRYTGSDRIGDDNSMTVGLEYSFRRLGQYLRGKYTLGQRVLFSNPRVRLPDESRIGSVVRALLVQEFSLKPREDTEIVVDWLLDNERGTTERSSFRIYWNPYEDGNVVSLWHSYRRDLALPLQSGVELSLPLGDNSPWRWHSKAVYAWRGDDDGLQSIAAGLQYRSCCWVLGTGLRRSLQSAGRGYSTSWVLDIQLPGFAAFSGN